MPGNPTIRVRFAPSPTGPLHIGGLRTALYNYLFAKKHGGQFILRIEDTDRKRCVDWAEQYIIEALEWCGLQPDEGPRTGGGSGPYRQSERRSSYTEFVEKLVASDDAYYAFDSPEELSARRRAAEQSGSVWQCDATTRGSMRNSIGMSSQEIADARSKEDYCVVRFKVDRGDPLVFDDLIRGQVVVDPATLDDKVILKSDGMPTYHLANIVDDHMMGITHVIRGEEWLPSAPLHILLYQALGWEAPQFAHLPLILKPTGKGKLSKRDGDQMGFPVFPLAWKDEEGQLASGYREAGFLPEAVVNMLALLGWHPGDEREIFSLSEMTKAFSIERIGRSGARFDPEKVLWFNSQYLQKMQGLELAEMLNAQLRRLGLSMLNEERALMVVEMMRPRIQLISDLTDKAMFLYRPPHHFSEKAVRKSWKNWAPSFLRKFANSIESDDFHTAAALEALIDRLCQTEEVGKGAVMKLIRLVLTGGSGGPGLIDIMIFLGMSECIRRIEKAICELP